VTVAMVLIQFYLFLVLGFFGAGALDKFSSLESGAVTYAAIAVGAIVSLVMLYIQASSM